MRVRTGRWYTRKHCVECDKSLSDDEESYSDGCCPYCGHISGSTFCETNPVAVRRVITEGPWWKFWDFRVSYERKDGKPVA